MLLDQSPSPAKVGDACSSANKGLVRERNSKCPHFGHSNTTVPAPSGTKFKPVNPYCSNF